MNQYRASSLNPFEFRAGIYLGEPRKCKMSNCLNPFEFRAGIYLLFKPCPVTITRLNPFEFRAGIYFEYIDSMVSDTKVLIPLNSGLVFTCLILPACKNSLQS